MKLSLLGELKRRNVLRAAVLYIGVIWALSQGAAQLLPVFDVSNWAIRWFVVASAIGFPFWIAFAWFFELTPEGLKLESEVHPGESIAAQTRRKLDFAIIGVLSIAVVLLLTDRLLLNRNVEQASPVAVAEKSIAVLPFKNISADKNQDYFSDGISGELLNLLARIPQLQVTARTSSLYFKDKNVAIPEIARKLHVAHILEGSVQKAGEQVRISVQLVNAGSNTQQWSQTYDRRIEDIFKLQDEIAGDVVKQLKIKLLGSAPKARKTDPKAYALFLQARALRPRHTAEALRQSTALFRRVLAIDPRYAPAWFGLARNLDYQAGKSFLPQREGAARAREAVEKALAIEPNYAEAYALLSYLTMYAGNDCAGGLKQLEHALALDPTSLYVLGSASNVLSRLSRPDEGLTIWKNLYRRDPYNFWTLVGLGHAQAATGDYDAAIISLRTALSMSPPDTGGLHGSLGVALLLKGDAKAALAEFERETVAPFRMEFLPMAYHALGRKADSDKALAAFMEKYPRNGAGNIAAMYAYRGEADKAFEWLNKEIEYSRHNGCGGFRVDPMFANIHSDPRWLPFLRKVGQAPEQTAKLKFKVTLPKAWQTEGVADAATASVGTTE